ncbi:MAG TPA: SDR family oxidoreductase [Anaerolineales bacterium]|nr:SDR family oxidoreductase [Anaerolineales bacterium]
MRILITGASGLLGLNLALDTTRRHTVFGTVHQHPLKTKAFTVIQSDLLAPGAVEYLLESTQPDWVIHCAALANLEACEADPLQAQKMNTELPRTLAKHVARSGARLVHISTDAVFDGLRGNYTEEDPPTPACVYSATKLAGEQAVAEGDPTAIIARVVFFGWSLSGTRSLAEFFFHNLSQGKPVMGFTDVLFCPLQVNDLAEILIRMLEMKLCGLYHVVSSESLSKYEFGMRLADRFKLDGNLIQPTSVYQSGLKAVRSPNLTLRSDKLAQALKQPLPSISTGLDKLYTLYQQGYPQFLQSLR